MESEREREGEEEREMEEERKREERAGEREREEEDDTISQRFHLSWPCISVVNPSKCVIMQIL